LTGSPGGCRASSWRRRWRAWRRRRSSAPGAVDAVGGPRDRDARGGVDRVPRLSARTGAARWGLQQPRRVVPERRCRPRSGPCGSTRRATARAASSRSWSASVKTRLAGMDDRILGLYAGGMRWATSPASCPTWQRDRARHDQPRHRSGARERRGLADPAARAGVPDRGLRPPDGARARGPLGQLTGGLFGDRPDRRG
jgi:hypothetical protein